MKKIKLVLLFLACLLSSVLFDAQESVAQSYQIRDSGYVGRRYVLQDIYWIDNEQILFLGWKPGDHTVLSDGRTVPNDGLYVWNVKTGLVQAVDKEISKLRSVCFQSVFTISNPPKGGGAPIERGYARYVFDVGDTPFVRFGRLFRSRERELDIQAIQDGILAVSPVSCKEFNPKQLRKRYGENPLPLLESGEYLDRTNQDPLRPQPLRYFQADGDGPIVLKKIPPTLVVATPRFSEYLQKYVFRELRRNSGRDSPMRMWTLDRTGAVVESVIPAGRLMSGSPDAMPSRSGWFVTSNAVASQSAGDAGGYLLSGTKIIKVIMGRPESFAVSPDGCKAAISIDTYEGGKGSGARIKMIELCSKEN